MQRKLVCMLPTFATTEYVKDTLMVPYYIAKRYDYSASIVYLQSSVSNNVAESYKGVQLISIPHDGKKLEGLRATWKLAVYLFHHYRDIDLLICFHFNYQTGCLGLLYKLLHRKGKFYIKCDGYGLWLSLFRGAFCFPGMKPRNHHHPIVKLKDYGIKYLLYGMTYLADRVSAETLKVCDYLKGHRPFIQHPNKLIQLLNGMDEEAIDHYGIADLPVEQKENLIISVGRHGTWPKNTQMLLDALARVNLKDWQVYFIGPIDPAFQSSVADFYQKQGDLKSSVHFIGPVYEQQKLWAYYNRAKVFIHTSLSESYGIVLCEAFRFNNYILSTDVGIAAELIRKQGGSAKQLLPHNDSKYLANRIQEIVDGDCNVALHYDNKSLSWSNEIEKLSSLLDNEN